MDKAEFNTWVKDMEEWRKTMNGYTCEICGDELSQDRIDFEHTVCEECEEDHE